MNQKLYDKISAQIEKGIELSHQYEVEELNKAKAFLNLKFTPTNGIEKALKDKMSQYAKEKVDWQNSLTTDEFSSAKYDFWMTGFLDACGLPPESDDFCRDWYLLKFLDLTTEALTELSSALNEEFRKTGTKVYLKN